MFKGLQRKTDGEQSTASVLTNLKLRTKLGISFGLLLAIMCALAAAMSTKLSAARDGAHWTEHTHIVLQELEDVVTGMVNQETGLRGFLLAGEETFLEPFEAGIAQFETSVADIRERTRANPVAQELISEIEAAGLAWRTEHALPAIAAMRNPAQVDEARARVISGAGKAQMDKLRALAAELYEMEDALLDERTDVLIASFTSGQIIIAVSVVAAVLISMTALGLMLRSVARPLSNVVDTITDLSQGKLDVDVPHAGRKDEVGRIGQGLVALKSSMIEARDLAEAVRRNEEEQSAVVAALSEALEQLADMDLTATISDSAVAGKYASLRDAFNKGTGALLETLKAVQASATEVSSQAEGMLLSVRDLTQRTETQAATLEESAAAIEEMGASVKSAATNAKDAEAATKENQRVASATGQVVQDAVKAMERIEKRSSDISKITTVIDDIAFQTNLLALNAGVEAARAGEAGRGFAVVASEVRQLAQRSAESAQQIKDLIMTSSSEIERGAGLVGEAGRALEDILGRVNELSGQITGISQANQEQAQGLEEINVGIRELDTVTQRNAAMTGEIQSSSDQMNRSAQDMLVAVKRFVLDEARNSWEGISRPVEAPSAAVVSDPQPKQANGNWAEF